MKLSNVPWIQNTTLSTIACTHKAKIHLCNRKLDLWLWLKDDAIVIACREIIDGGDGEGDGGGGVMEGADGSGVPYTYKSYEE